MVKELLRLLYELETWQGVQVTPDGSGVSIALGREQLGHLEWSGRIDLPFPPEVRDRPVAERLAHRDPDSPEAHRVVFEIDTAPEISRAMWLLRLRYRFVDREAPRRADESVRLPR